MSALSSDSNPLDVLRAAVSDAERQYVSPVGSARSELQSRRAALADVERLVEAARVVDYRSRKAPWFREYYRVNELQTVLARFPKPEETP